MAHRARRPGPRRRGHAALDKGLRTIIGLVVLLVFLVPFAWMLLSSFKTQDQIFNDVYPMSVWTLLPRTWTLANFSAVLFEGKLGRDLFNTAFVAIAQVGLTLVVCSLGAFAFSRLHWRGSKLGYGLILLGLMIPFEAVTVPLFQIVRHLGLTTSYAVVFLPWVASPFAIFLLKQAYDELPTEMIEAALIDGASYRRVFWTVATPLIKPSIATVALLTFVDAWNSFLWPLIALEDPDKQLVSVAIAQTSVPGALPNWGEIFAGASAATIPVLIVFIFVQRYFIEGITFSAAKG